LEKALATDSLTMRGASDNSRQLQAAVTAALKEGNYQVAATKSMLLCDEIEKQLGTEAAEPFRILSIDIPGSVLVRSEPLIFDASQQKYVLGPDAVHQIAQFQKVRGLKGTGVCTAVKLPDLSSIQIGAVVDPSAR